MTPLRSVLRTLIIVGAIATAGCSAVAGQAQPAPDGVLPGGTAGKDLLAQHHWINEQGRLTFGEVRPKDRAILAAQCDYLFGTVAEVSRVAKLSGTVNLDEASGYDSAGGGGTGFSCVYDIDHTPVFGLRIWSQPAESTEGADHVVTVELPEGFQGSCLYAAGRTGPVIAESLARRWLTEAGGRVLATG